MTQTLNGHTRPVTDGEGVRVRVHGTENPPSAPEHPPKGRKSTYTRVIARLPKITKTSPETAARNFASPHVKEAVDAARTSPLAVTRPEPLANVARRTLPTTGFRTTPVRWSAQLATGLIRLAITAIAYLLAASVATNKRSAVTAAIATLLAAINVLARITG